MTDEQAATPITADSPAHVLQRQFVPLEHVEKVLAISKSQAYALVRSGELRAIRVGGRGQWRIELTELEAYIERAYTSTAQAIACDDIP